MLATRTERKEKSMLKHPELQGTYPCGLCSRVFNHCSSLNRHRRVRHNEAQQCLLCKNKMAPKEDLHDHMRIQHNISPVYTCGCCNYTFDAKKLLKMHYKSMNQFGTIGDAAPIAISDYAPGSLGKPRVGKTPVRRFEKTGSMSPSSGAGTSSESSGSSRAPSPPPPLASTDAMISVKTEADEINDSCRELVNDVVKVILDSGVYSGDQLTLPETWEKIEKAARNAVIEHLEGVVSGRVKIETETD